MATTKQHLEWIETTPARLADYCGEWLPLWVEDSVMGHATLLASAADVPAALADYAAGYETDATGEITVRWRLFRDGEEIGHGRHTWTR